MSLTGSRLESYRFELLDRLERYITDLTTVKGGSLTHNRATELRSGGSLTLTDTDLDWLDGRVRITYQDGEDSYPLGIYIAASPGIETDGVTRERTVELYSKLLVLSQDLTESSFTLTAGTNVTTAIRAVISSAGETKVALTDSDAVTPADTVWSAGTSKLRIVNDLLDSINYFALDVNEAGYFIAKPYQAPADRPSMWAFTNGSAALHSPTMSVDADFFNVSNRVVLVSGDAETEMVAIAEDYDSPFGYNARGRWITDYREGEEATDQATLDARADRYLAEGRQVSETVKLQHPWLPIHPNDVVTVDEPGVTSGPYTLHSSDHKLNELGAVVTTEATRVVV